MKIPSILKYLKQHPILIYILVPLLVTALVSLVLFQISSRYLIDVAKKDVQQVLLSHRAFHHYIQRVMHPAFYQARNHGDIKADFYDPAILSSSYIIRVLHGFYSEEAKNYHLNAIYYKMAATNPRNPVNRADAFEADLIARFNRNRSLREYQDIIRSPEGTFLRYAIPFLETQARCLACHGKREDAPPGVRQRYAGMGGFGEKEGTIRAIESIRVPIDSSMYTASIVTGAASSGALALMILAIFSSRLRRLVTDKTAHLEEEITAHRRTEENLRLDEDRLQSLLRLSQASGMGEDELVAYALEECVTLTGSVMGYLHWYNGENGCVTFGAWSTGALARCTAPKERHAQLDSAGIWAECIRRGEAVIHNDFAATTGSRGLPPGHAPLSRHLSVPIRDGAAIVGVIGVGNKALPYDDSDATQLELYAGSLWSIIMRNRSMDRIEQSLREKELLLKEVHHRVKNNMAVISSLITLQADYVADDRDRDLFQKSTERIKSMALIHDRLYRSRDFVQVDFREYIDQLTRDLFETYQADQESIALAVDIDDVAISLDNAVPCGLIINELVTNALRHAFKGRDRGTIRVSLKRCQLDRPGICLEVADDGRGLSTTEGIEKGETLGMMLIHALVKQIHGSIELTSDGGTTVKIRFPESGTS